VTRAPGSRAAGVGRCAVDPDHHRDVRAKRADSGARWRRRPGALEPTRIAETFEASLAPAPIADALSVARVRRTRGRWRVDPAFKAQRVRR
jgi:hypothetical protein